MVYKGFTKWRSAFVRCKYGGDIQDAVEHSLRNIGEVELLDIQHIFDGFNLYGVQITYGFGKKERIYDGTIEKV